MISFLFVILKNISFNAYDLKISIDVLFFGEGGSN